MSKFYSQRKVISTLKTALKSGAEVAAKQHKVTPSTVSTWAASAGVTLPRMRSRVDWGKVKEALEASDK